MARLLEAEGDLDGALVLLDEAERVYVGDFSPRVRPIPALKARVLVKQGRLEDVRRWARDEGLSATDELTYLREFEHLTLARALLAEARVDEASDLLARLLEAAEAGAGPARSSRPSWCSPSPCTGAATFRRRWRPWSGRSPWPSRRATCGCSSTKGAPMAELLRAPLPRTVPRRRTPGSCSTASTVRRPRVVRASDGGLVEPLSERELDVLRLLATDLSGPEIARHLVVSLNTVRTHTKNIYAKLGVNSRRAAVRRAEQLDL